MQLKLPVALVVTVEIMTTKQVVEKVVMVDRMGQMLKMVLMQAQKVIPNLQAVED